MYGKLFAQMYDGTLSQHGWQTLITFQQFIILADKDGSVDMTLDSMSRRTTIPLEILEAGMPKLLAPDPHSRTPDQEGRRLVPLVAGRPWGWRIVNHEHYRKIRTAEERRDYLRTYQADKRAGVPKGQRGKRSTEMSTMSTKSTEAVSSKQEADAITADASNGPAAEVLRHELRQNGGTTAAYAYDLIFAGANESMRSLAERIIREQALRSGWPMVVQALVDMAAKRVTFSMSAFQKFVRGARVEPVPVAGPTVAPRDDRWCVECGDGRLEIPEGKKRGQRVHLESCSRAPVGIS